MKTSKSPHSKNKPQVLLRLSATMNIMPISHSHECTKTRPGRQSKSISSSAQFVDPEKYFSHPSLSYLLFSTAILKLKLGLQIGGRVLIATNKSNYLANQKHGAINKYDDCIYQTVPGLF
jgi:hypothetical protein